MATIDTHAHIVLPELADALRARTAPPLIERGDDGKEYLVRFMGRGPIRDGSVETLLAEMDAHGVRQAVLSNQLPDITNRSLDVSEPLCRTFNDAASAACTRYPDRFRAFAALPFATIDAAVAEFERAMALPGFVGALLPVDGFLSAQRAEKFVPLLAAADRRHALLLVHYGSLPDDPEAPKPDVSDNRLWRVGTLDMQSRISSAMVTFCFTDLLVKYPNVTIMTHNLGGNIPFEVERLDHRAMTEAPGAKLPSAVFRDARLLVDCNSMGARAIERAVEVYGAEKITFGSDGTAFGMKWTQAAIDEARISDADREAIRSRNAGAALDRVRVATLSH
jgi:predicted TIM-barrel fold metal-dependent hydrolase